MPRPMSWLPRLHEISRSVANSVRSHYSRQELERLFELQPRAAQKLVELLPSVAIGTARLVDRDVLSGFLDRVRDAEDLPALFHELRQDKAQPSRRSKIRALVPRDFDPISVDALPDSIKLSAGRIEVNCKTVLELAEVMWAIAKVIETDEFARVFEIQESVAPDSGAEDMKSLFEELEAMEASWRDLRAVASEEDHPGSQPAGER